MEKQKLLGVIIEFGYSIYSTLGFSYRFISQCSYSPSSKRGIGSFSIVPLPKMWSEIEILAQYPSSLLAIPSRAVWVLQLQNIGSLSNSGEFNRGYICNPISEIGIYISIFNNGLSLFNSLSIGSNRFGI